MDFSALDFETANREPESACSIGVAVVCDGRVVQVMHELIRPPSLDFDKRLTAIHGISAENVKDAPTFQEVWPRVRRLIGDGPIAMHNASFDLRVLLACLTFSNIEVPDLRYFCTLRLARALLPGLPNHRLTTLTRVFGIALDHHRAGSDAVACAQLALLLIRLLGPNELPFHIRSIQAYRLDAHPARVEALAVSVRFEDLQTDKYFGDEECGWIPQIAAPDGRFEGMSFAFTGELCFLTRAEARRLVEVQGGITSNSVSEKTAYLVVGDDAWSAYKHGGKTTGKLARALQLQQAGAQIKIIDEDEFLDLCGALE